MIDLGVLNKDCNGMLFQEWEKNLSKDMKTKVSISNIFSDKITFEIKGDWYEYDELDEFITESMPKLLIDVIFWTDTNFNFKWTYGNESESIDGYTFIDFVIW